MKYRKIPLGALVFILGCAVAAWSIEPEVHHKSREVEFAGAEVVEIDLRIGAAEVVLGAIEGAKLSGDFKFDDEDSEPHIEYRVEDKRGFLRIADVGAGDRDESVGGSGDMKGDGDWGFTNEQMKWDLLVGNYQPVKLTLDAGVVSGDIDLRDLQLRGVDISAGVGEIDLDLRGAWQGNIEGIIEVGFGELRLTLPEDIGLAVVLENAIGSVEMDGLEQVDGEKVQSEGFNIPFLGIEIKPESGGWFDRNFGQNGVWTNQAYGEASNNLRLRVKMGVGSLQVRAD